MLLRLQVEDPLAMKKNPPNTNPDDRVVPLRKTTAYRRRGASLSHGWTKDLNQGSDQGPNQDFGNAANPGAAQGHPQIGDLDRYPQTEEADDYRHRMMTNLAGVAIAVVLIVTGIWIADTMASMRKNQDCVLSGRRGCTPVDAPLPQRW